MQKVFIILLIATETLVKVHSLIGPYDIPDGFCRDRADNKCCENRDDNCDRDDRGTKCYCDNFCHQSGDCCVDMNSTCYGKEDLVLKKCNYNGKFYNGGQSFSHYCNTCDCMERDRFMELKCTMYTCIIDDKMSAEINQMQNEWVAGSPQQFWSWKFSDAMSQMLGTFRSRKKVADMLPKYFDVRPQRLPAFFDAREKWRGKITPPPYQKCGASWVFSTVSVASDRWNIMSNGTFTGSLSFQHLLSCNKRNKMGCQGGHLTKGWSWIHDFGLVKEDCYKWTGDNSRCHLPKQKGATTVRCLDAGRRTPTKLYYTAPVNRISGNQYQIMKEIMDNGPVQATMDIFRDFFLYESGVYSCPTHYKRSQIISVFPPVSQYPGYHSVRIIGWGEEHINGKLVKYWIVANSWGQSWGEGGYFRIRRGINSCNIEEFILAPWIHEN